MFICSHCRFVVGPHISPAIRVSLIRPVEYHNTRKYLDEYNREKTEKIVSEGTEIVREDKLCPKCAGEPVVELVAVPLKQVVHEEKAVAPLRAPIIASLVDSTLATAERISKGKDVSLRQRADCALCVPLIKHFTDNNTNYRF